MARLCRDVLEGSWGRENTQRQCKRNFGDDCLRHWPRPRQQLSDLMVGLAPGLGIILIRVQSISLMMTLSLSASVVDYFFSLAGAHCRVSCPRIMIIKCLGRHNAHNAQPAQLHSMAIIKASVLGRQLQVLQHRLNQPKRKHWRVKDH